MIFQRSSKDLICVSNCHSKSFASPLFCWSQGGWHLVLKQSLRTILPRVSLSCLPPGNTDWSNSPGSRTYTFLVCTCFHICGIITSYNKLITCKCPYENYEERKCPGSPNSKWTLNIFMYKVSHFTFFKPFNDEFKMVKGAVEGPCMVQYLLCDGVENLEKKTAVPSEGLWHRGT